MKYTPVPNDQYTKEMAKRDERVIKKAIRNAKKMTTTKDTPKCPNCGDGTIPSGDTWKLTPKAEQYYKDHPEDRPRVNFSGCPVCGREDTPKETVCEHKIPMFQSCDKCDRVMVKSPSPDQFVPVKDTPKETKKALMQEAFDTCVEEGRSDFYMLAYIMGVADVDHDTALDFIIKKLQMKQIK